MSDARIATTDAGLLRDLHSKALLSCDKGALARHRRDVARRAEHTRLEQEVVALRERLDHLTELVAVIYDTHPHG
jgi:hypothetical protein